MANNTNQEARNAKTIEQVGKDKKTWYQIIFNFEKFGNNKTLSSDIRQGLLKFVGSEVEIRLNSSLHNRVYIIPDAEQNPKQIETPWESEVKVGSKAKVHLTNTQITAVYDRTDIAGKLLILGQPGVGKTAMLLQLADELVKRANLDLTHPVPVLFSLSSWKNDTQNIKDWLVDQLKNKCKVRKDIAKQLVNNQKIIPLLDGLDELAAERQKNCVIKINDFIKDGWSNPLVICSRIEEYKHHKALLQMNNSLELHPFTQEQVYQYLQKTGNREFWDNINQNEQLNQLANIPFLLNIIVLSAKEIKIQTWQQLESFEERLSYLFEAYILTMFSRFYQDEKSKHKKQPKHEDTRYWLKWLACRLIEENATEFVIEKMQPNWLKNKFLNLIYNLVIWGVIGTIIYGLYVLTSELIAELYLNLHYEDFKIYGLTFRLTSRLTSELDIGLIVGLIYGLIYGLIGDFIENIVEKKIASINHLKKLSKTVISSLIIGLIVGLINGLIFWLNIGLIDEQAIKQIEQLVKVFNLSNDNDIEQFFRLCRQNIKLCTLTLALIPGLISGVASGLIFGLIGNQIRTTEIIRFSFKKFSNGLVNWFKNGLKWGTIISLIYFLIAMPISVLYKLKNSNILGLIKSLTFGNVNILGLLLIFVLISGLTSGLISGLIFGLNGNRIWSIETIEFSFSFKKFSNGLENGWKNGLKYGAISGLLLGLIAMVIGVLIGDPKQGQIFFATLLAIYGLFSGATLLMIFMVIPMVISIVIPIAISAGIFMGIFMGSIFGLFSGINRLEIENKTYPNQGIWQSVTNTGIFSVFGFLFASLIIFGFQIILKSKMNIQVLISNLSLAIAFGILVGILVSGIPVLKHFILRIILWSSGKAPSNYAKFLNYCTNRLFLQRVGGDYRFMHDLLRKHFAEMILDPIQVIPVEPSPLIQNYITCTECDCNNSVDNNFCTKCGANLTKPHI